MFKRKKLLDWKFLLFLIVCIASFLRFWQLGTIPAGFHEDEVAYGYNAYSLLLTGTDEYGKQFPLVLESFGEYKPALYAYLTVPMIALFDLTPFAVRFMCAFFGVLSIIACYFFTNTLLRNKNIALITAFLLAISPWHIALSRTVSEVVVSLFFLLFLGISILRCKEKFSYVWFSLAIISGFFAMGSYTASRFFVLLFTGLLTIFSVSSIKKIFSFKLSLIILFGIFCLFAGIFSFFDSSSRLQQISILQNAETQLVLNEQIREDKGVAVPVVRLFHNKAINYVRTVLFNLNDYFTLDYLFLNGGMPYRVLIPASGLFYLWQLPFLLYGIYLLVKRRDAISFFLISWWVVLLIPACFTFHEIPNVYRSLVVLPAITIIIAIGIYYSLLYFFVKKKAVAVALVILLLFIGLCEFVRFTHQYTIHYERHHPWYRGFAFKELVDELQKVSPKYDEILITKGQGSAYIYLLFYQKYNPLQYQKEGSRGNVNLSGFDKYIFIPEDCFFGRAQKKGILSVVKGDCKIPKTFVVIKTIFWQDNTPAFKFVEYKPPKKKINTFYNPINVPAQ